jgi:ATP-dependent exoDNAse (exonuclease V) alpha subunit
LGKAVGSAPHTLAEFKVNKALQNQAKGRSIYCDEFSMVGNADVTWLLEFARDNNCRLVFFGDRKQLQSVSRGNPVNDLIEANLIQYAELQKIYRQKDPELLAAVTASAEGRFQESVDRVKANGWFHTDASSFLI